MLHAFASDPWPVASTVIGHPDRGFGGRLRPAGHNQGFIGSFGRTRLSGGANAPSQVAGLVSRRSTSWRSTPRTRIRGTSAPLRVG